MPHNPASIVRLLYGERVVQEKIAPKRFLYAASNSLTSAPPIGQGQRSRAAFENAWNGERASKPVSVILCPARSWLGRLLPVCRPPVRNSAAGDGQRLWDQPVTRPLAGSL
jgi:hypothetical protein